MKRVNLFFVTGFFSGYSPIISGTAGTLAAVPIYLILAHLPFRYYLLTIIISLAPVAYLCNWAENYFQKEDPSEVVIDEIIGFLVTMTALPVGLFTITAGFILFRIFDIVKPYPVYQSQQLPHGWGVLIDDVLAGLYANLTLWIVYLIYRAVL